MKLAAQVSKITIAKGKKVVTFAMGKDRPDDDTLLAHMLGPTGNPRAPVIRKGKNLFVGFDEEAYTQLL